MNEQPAEGYQRPDHDDFATSAELKKREFTGTRNNSITGNFEFWFFGEVVKEVTQAERILRGDKAIYEAHKEVFSLK